jgi:hypothetical protein
MIEILDSNPNETGAQSGIGMTFSRTQAGPGPFMILSLTPGVSYKAPLIVSVSQAQLPTKSFVTALSAVS